MTMGNLSHSEAENSNRFRGVPTNGHVEELLINPQPNLLVLSRQ